MRWSFKVATIAGTEVRIHVTFFILLAFVALHGFTQIGRSWEPIIARLQQRLPGIAVAAPDLPGHGAGGDPCDLATAATALARRFGRSIWIGYSMGGRHLLRLAVDHPEVVEAMVLISTTKVVV